MSPSRLAPPATALVALVALVGCNPQVDIVHGLEELEANEILVVLKSRGIDGDKQKEEGRIVTWAVNVGQVDRDDALRILVANKMPKTRPNDLKAVYPVGGGGLIPTKSEEKAKFLMAIQGEIERKLKTLPGIVSAHVGVVMPDKDIVRDLDTPPPPATASVAIVFNAIDERGTPAVSEADVRRLVASSVEDLREERVIVVMKKNAPGTLVNDLVDDKQLDTAPAAAVFVGMRFADKGSQRAAQGMLIGAAALTGIGLVFGFGSLARSMAMRRRAARAEAELTSVRKAGRATQTGLQAKAE